MASDFPGDAITGHLLAAASSGCGSFRVAPGSSLALRRRVKFSPGHLSAYTDKTRASLRAAGKSAASLSLPHAFDAMIIIYHR